VEVEVLAMLSSLKANVIAGLGIGILLAATAASSAEVVLAVDWGGEYVTGYRGSQRGQTAENQTNDYGGDPGINDWRRYIPFSEATPFNPAIGTTYSGVSAVYYGGCNMIRYDATGTGYSGVASGTPDVIEASYTQNLTYGGQGAAVVLWKKADFLNGADAIDKLALSDATKLEIDIRSDAEHMVFRLVVKNGSQYYVSNTTAVKGSLLTISNPAAETWATFNPANSDNMFTDVGSSFTTRVFDDVQAIGFYSFGTATNGQHLYTFVNGAEFHVGPEPATMGLLGLGLGGLTALRRRRR
jgi:hypothetical protein